MNQLLTCCALISIMATNAPAQSVTPEQASKRVFFHSVLGLTAPGVSNLNGELSKAGFLPLSGTYFTRGAGLYTVFPKVRLATLITFVSYTGTTTDATRTSWARGTNVGSSLGFLARNTDRVHVVPFVGLAYSFFGARVSDVVPGSATFGGYLAGPNNQQYVGTEQWLGNVGLHLAKPGLGQAALLQRLMIGLRAGYMVPLAAPTWQTNGVRLGGGPSVNSGGTYLYLMIGSAL